MNQTPIIQEAESIYALRGSIEPALLQKAIKRIGKSGIEKLRPAFRVMPEKISPFFQ